MSALDSDVLDDLRAQLETRRRLIEEQLRALHDAIDALDSAYSVGDRTDAGTDHEERTRTRTEEYTLRQVLREIEHALSKFEIGTYGLCEACKQPIPVGRLRILPEARFDTAHTPDASSAGRSAM